MKSESLKHKYLNTMKKLMFALALLLSAGMTMAQTPEEKAARAAAMEEATLYAASVPLKTMEASLKALPLALEMAQKGNPASASDAGVAALAAVAGIRGAALNVRINAAGLTDKAPAEPLLKRADAIVAEALALQEEVLDEVNRHIDN